MKKISLPKPLTPNNVTEVIGLTPLFMHLRYYEGDAVCDRLRGCVDFHLAIAATGESVINGVNMFFRHQQAPYRCIQVGTTMPRTEEGYILASENDIFLRLRYEPWKLF